MSSTAPSRSIIACVVLAAFASSCSFLFVQPLKTNEPVREAALKCTSSNIAPGLDMTIAGWQVVHIMIAASASESAYQGSGISQGGDIALGVLFGALAIGSAFYGFSATEECRIAGGGPDTRGTRRRSAREERDEEAAAQARAATLANMAAQQAQAAGIAANKASAAAGPGDADAGAARTDAGAPP